MDIDNMLLDLEVIRQLAENDKLAVNIYPGVTTLIVDKSSYLSSITRKINGYSRDDSIKYLENLVQQIEKSCDVRAPCCLLARCSPMPTAGRSARRAHSPEPQCPPETARGSVRAGCAVQCRPFGCWDAATCLRPTDTRQTSGIVCS